MLTYYALPFLINERHGKIKRQMLNFLNIDQYLQETSSQNFSFKYQVGTWKISTLHHHDQLPELFQDFFSASTQTKLPKLKSKVLMSGAQASHRKLITYVTITFSWSKRNLFKDWKNFEVSFFLRLLIGT